MKKNKPKIKFFEEIKRARGYLDVSWCVEHGDESENISEEYYEDSKKHHWFLSKKIRFIHAINYKSDLSLISLGADDSSLRNVSNESDIFADFQSGSIVSVSLNPNDDSTYGSFADSNIEEITLLIKKANTNENESAKCHLVEYLSSYPSQLYFEVVLSEKNFTNLFETIGNNKKYSIKFHAACLGFYASNRDKVKLLMSYHDLIIPPDYNVIPSYVGAIEKFGIFVEIEKPDDSYEFIFSKNILSILNQTAKNIVVIKVLLMLTFISVFTLIIFT